jgi:hypothetical protein
LANHTTLLAEVETATGFGAATAFVKEANPKITADKMICTFFIGLKI